MNSTTRYAIVGAGNRGLNFAKIIKENPHMGTVVAAADPSPVNRGFVQKLFNLPDSALYDGWDSFAKAPKMADAVINATMDRTHRESSIPLMEKGYHMLLEKPMAITLEDCEAIVASQKKTGVMVAVCHCLRHHPLIEEIKNILDSKILGKISHYEMLEPVGHVHFAHSFVRGNWGREAESSFFLMTKCCHDLDIIAYLINERCTKVSSVGHLEHFTKANRPEGAPSRCLEGCPVERDCPYSATKMYLDPQSKWPRIALMHEMSHEEKVKALMTGPFGKCVYDCGNDVMENQSVLMQFESGTTATFIATAFHPSECNRYIRIYGTQGFLQGDMDSNQIQITDLKKGIKQTTQVPVLIGSHGGADTLIMESFAQALQKNDPSFILTSAVESLRSHRIVFEAEKARVQNKLIEIL